MRNKPKPKFISYDKNRIIPDVYLMRYMREKLQLEKKKHQATTGGKELSEEESRRYNSLRTEKERILEKTIFPAMTNLIFFFKCIDEEPILFKTFKDDVEELLGIRRTGPSPGNYGIYFTLLFESILGLNSDYDKHDFRLRLMREAMRVIYLKMMKISPTVYENLTGSVLTIKYVGEDMGRAYSRTDDISREIKDPKEEAPNKTLFIDTRAVLNREYLI